MNFQTTPVWDPIRVLIVNALSPTAKLIIAKILSGIVFGESQLVDLIIVAYSNEIEKAIVLKTELDMCAFPCLNSIKVSSDLPCISDGDVFCFISSFSNPNVFDFQNVDTEERFDTLYLISKIANNLVWPDDTNKVQIEDKTKKRIPGKVKQLANKKQKRKPIFVADGLIAVDILYSLSKNMPSDVFFYFTPLQSIGKSILAEYLSVQSKAINEMLVWAANDEVFYMEVEKPLIIHDGVSETSCNSGMIGKDFLESINLDPTQFNDTWMKKDFIEKVATSASKNPYGNIYKAAEFAKSLRDIWVTRRLENGMKAHTCNMGVISNGSLGTEKGLPMVLPIIFRGECWSVSTNHFEDNSHLKQELKRINETAKKHHKKLLTHCKKFLEENVINQAFIPSDVDSGSLY